MIEVYKTAKELPEAWDRAAGSNIALHRENLALLERVNPCQQEYIVFRDHEVHAVFVKYVLNIDIFCYSKLHLYLPITIIGIPCSVAEPGYHFSEGGRTEVKEYLRALKGAKLVLNADENLDFLGFTKGYTLPSCVMDINMRSFDEYMEHLRSHYRYRYKKALKKAEGLAVEILEGEFDARLYALYEQVYKKSAYKLEKLSIDFFREAKATVAVFKDGEVPVAFVQYRIDGEELAFLFGGLNYSLNQKYDLYQNMLLYLVKTAIECNCTSLNLGQTAEEMKCKLGAVQQKKYLYIHHSNSMIDWFVKKLNRFFSYRMNELRLKVFKEQE